MESTTVGLGGIMIFLVLILIRLDKIHEMTERAQWQNKLLLEDILKELRRRV
jgi:hypothetical protein